MLQFLKNNRGISKSKRKIVCLSVVSLLAGCIMLELALLMQLSTDSSTSTVQTYLKQPLPFNKNVPLIRYFDRGGFDLPDWIETQLTQRTALWTRDVQLCVMFNSVISSKTIGLLLSYYLQFFSHITLISGTQLIVKPHFVPDSVQVFNCDSYYGWYQQKCLRICLENPASDRVEGFLYVADDMFIDVAKMSQLDRNKLWMIPAPTLFNYTHIVKGASKAELHRQWFWFGFPRYTEYYLQKTISKLPGEWIEALKTNTGFPSVYEVHAASDIYYIPSSFVPRMVEVISFIVSTADLFCEVALPLSVGIVTRPSERQFLIDGYLWGKERTIHMKEARSKVAHFVHPLKLSHTEDLILWKKLMQAQLRQAVAKSS